MIDSFKGEYRFLSNFYPSELIMDEQLYPTVEHAFQASKTLDQAERDSIRLANTPSQAKTLGRTVVLRPGWDDMRVLVMRSLLVAKFEHPELRSKLIATGDQELVEGNYWGDKFWGVCRGEGENWLGHLLMEIREGLQ